MDIVVINMDEPPSLLRNDLTGSGAWLKVFLVGTKSNRSAIGSRVVAHYDGKKQAQSVTAQASFYSVNDRRLHFGLGTANSADVDVYWASGRHEKYLKLPANHLISIQEGTGVIRRENWSPKSRAGCI